MARKISWADAAEIIGVSCRTMRRWRERLEEHGYSGLADRRKGTLSAKRVPLKTVEQVLAWYRDSLSRPQHPAPTRSCGSNIRSS